MKALKKVAIYTVIALIPLLYSNVSYAVRTVPYTLEGTKPDYTIIEESPPAYKIYDSEYFPNGTILYKQTYRDMIYYSPVPPSGSIEGKKGGASYNYRNWGQWDLSKNNVARSEFFRTYEYYSQGTLTSDATTHSLVDDGDGSFSHNLNAGTLKKGTKINILSITQEDSYKYAYFSTSGTGIKSYNNVARVYISKVEKTNSSEATKKIYFDEAKDRTNSCISIYDNFKPYMDVSNSYGVRQVLQKSDNKIPTSVTKCSIGGKSGEWRYLGLNSRGTIVNNPYFPGDHLSFFGNGSIAYYDWRLTPWDGSDGESNEKSPSSSASLFKEKFDAPVSAYDGTSGINGKYSKQKIAVLQKLIDAGYKPSFAPSAEEWAKRLSLQTHPTEETPIFVGLRKGVSPSIEFPSRDFAYISATRDMYIATMKIIDPSSNKVVAEGSGSASANSFKQTKTSEKLLPGTQYTIEVTLGNGSNTAIKANTLGVDVGTNKGSSSGINLSTTLGDTTQIKPVVRIPNKGEMGSTKGSKSAKFTYPITIPENYEGDYLDIYAFVSADHTGIDNLNYTNDTGGIRLNIYNEPKCTGPNCDDEPECTGPNCVPEPVLPDCEDNNSCPIPPEDTPDKDPSCEDAGSCPVPGDKPNPDPGDDPECTGPNCTDPDPEYKPSDDIHKGDLSVEYIELIDPTTNKVVYKKSYSGKITTNKAITPGKTYNIKYTAKYSGKTVYIYKWIQGSVVNGKWVPGKYVIDKEREVKVPIKYSVLRKVGATQDDDLKTEIDEFVTTTGSVNMPIKNGTKIQYEVKNVVLEHPYLSTGFKIYTNGTKPSDWLNIINEDKTNDEMTTLIHKYFDIKIENLKVLPSTEYIDDNPDSFTFNVIYDAILTTPSFVKNDKYQTNVDTSIKVGNTEVEVIDQLVAGENKDITHVISGVEIENDSNKLPVEVVLNFNMESYESGNYENNVGDTDVEIEKVKDPTTVPGDKTASSPNNSNNNSSPNRGGDANNNCLVPRTKNTYNSTYKIHSWNSKPITYNTFSGNKKIEFRNYYTESDTSKTISNTEEFVIDKVLFRSKYTKQKGLGVEGDGWVDLTNSRESKNAIVSAGYGFELKVVTNYETNALTNNPSWNANSISGTTVNNLSSGINITEDVYVEVPGSNSSKMILSSTGYKNTVLGLVKNTVTKTNSKIETEYTIKPSKTVGAVETGKIYIPTNLKDGKYKISVYTPPITGVSSLAETNKSKYSALCDRKDLEIIVSGSSTDDLNSHITQ